MVQKIRLKPVKKQDTLYVFKNGTTQSKIGITDDVVKRVKSAQTYGFEYYNHYILPNASEIEAKIKGQFSSSRVAKAKEVFAVSAEELDSAVSKLVLNPGALEEQKAIPVTKQYLSIFSESFEKTIKKPKGVLSLSDYDIKTARRQTACELFAKEFNLGIPMYKLPEDLDVVESWLPVDYLNRKPVALFESKYYYNNTPYFKHNGSLFFDHIYRFYDIVTLSTGKRLAFCTAIVSMPYPSGGKAWDNVGGEEWVKAWEKTPLTNLEQYADDYGYSVTRHDEWSWWNRGTDGLMRTGLFLVKQKTPVQRRLALWKSSFKKWAIESSEMLKREWLKDLDRLGYNWDSSKRDDIEKALEDIQDDRDFPLHIKNKGDFALYLKDSIGRHYEDESSFPFRDAFDFLFAKWKGLDYEPISYSEEDEEEEATGVLLNGEWVEYPEAPTDSAGRWVVKTDEDEYEYLDWVLYGEEE